MVGGLCTCELVYVCMCVCARSAKGREGSNEKLFCFFNVKVDR